MYHDRAHYHHGDLPAALIAAGLELARHGGPSAIALREVTRAAGVTPNAAYRHFPDRASLVLAVAERAWRELAEAMRAHMADADAELDSGRRAVLRLRAVGMAYVDFAVHEPGWFQLVFHNGDQLAGGPPPVAGIAEPSGEAEARGITSGAGGDQSTGGGDPGSPQPFRVLVAALDDLVATGVLAGDRRVHAEWAYWAAIHGLSDLVTRGPLHGQDVGTINELAHDVIDRAIAGLIAGDSAAGTAALDIPRSGRRTPR